MSPSTPPSIDVLDVLSQASSPRRLPAVRGRAAASWPGWRWRRPFETLDAFFASARADRPRDAGRRAARAHRRASAARRRRRRACRRCRSWSRATTRRTPPAGACRRGRPRTVAAELDALNDAYEERFGFRYCVFVAGRSRDALLPDFAAAMAADRDAELRRAIDAVIDIAARPACETDRTGQGRPTVIELGANRYGKAAIRLVRVDRASRAATRVRDLTVAIALEGDFTAAHTDGDNALVVATDTMKNTAYAFAAGPSRRRRSRPTAWRSPSTSSRTPRWTAPRSTSASTPGGRSRSTAARARDAFVRGGEGTRVATVTATPRQHVDRGRRRGPHRDEDDPLGVHRLPARPVHDPARDRRPADGDEARRRSGATARPSVDARRDVRRRSARRCSRSSPTTTARPSRPRSGSWPTRSSTVTRRSTRCGWSCRTSTIGWWT